MSSTSHGASFPALVLNTDPISWIKFPAISFLQNVYSWNSPGFGVCPLKKRKNGKAKKELELHNGVWVEQDEMDELPVPQCKIIHLGVHSLFLLGDTVLGCCTLLIFCNR